MSNRIKNNKAQSNTQRGSNSNNFLRLGDLNNTSVTDLKNIEGTPGQSIQVDSAGKSLEFVDVPAKTKCFSVAMSLILG